MVERLHTALVYILLALWTVFVVFPIFWVITTSFKGELAVFLGPKYLPFVDFTPTLQWWQHFFTTERGELVPPVINSLFIAGISAVFVTILGSMAAYALSRFRFKFGYMRNRDILIFIISQRMMPPIVTVVAIYIMMQYVHLIDTPLALILTYIAFNLPIAVWVMYNFFSQLPRSIEEAALVDGASPAQILFRIVLPITSSSLAATFFLSFIFAWNEFIFAAFLTYTRAETLPILIAAQHFQRGPQWWSISVLVTIALLPPIILTIAFQRYFIKGLIPVSK